jgi:hypothetical protein
LTESVYVKEALAFMRSFSKHSFLIRRTFQKFSKSVVKVFRIITSGAQSTMVVAIKAAKTSDLATRCETAAEVVGAGSDGAGDGAVDGSRLLGAWVVGFPVGSFEGAGEGIEDEVGAPVGADGTFDGGMVDGKPVGDADGMPVV